MKSSMTITELSALAYDEDPPADNVYDHFGSTTPKPMVQKNGSCTASSLSWDRDDSDVGHLATVSLAYSLISVKNLLKYTGNL